MIISFKDVEIHNFQSIKKAKVILSEQGVVSIKGVNLYETKTGSNGAGKSSIAESVCYALFGTTSKGIRTCSNRYSDDDCLVILNFDIDKNSYKIVRGEKGKKHTGYVEFYCNDEDLTARNKSDTDKIILETLPVSKDIFLASIFLSQNFAGKLSSLSPSGRKDRLEQITNIDEKINEFKDRLSKLKSQYGDKYNKEMRDVSYAEGRISYINTQIFNKEREIDNLNKEIEDLKNKEDINIEPIKEKITNIESQINQISSLIEKTNNNISEFNDKINKRNIEINTLKSRYSYLKKEIDTLRSGKKCPTCGHQLVGAASADVINEKEIELRDIEVKVKNLEDSNKPDIEAKNMFSTKYSDLLNKNRMLSQMITNSNNLLNEAIQKNTTISSKENKVEEYKDNIKIFNEEKSSENLNMNAAQEKADIYETNQAVSNHCLQIVTKQFRNYLLDNTINYLNKLLEEYSSYLFDSDIISLVSDGGKLEIYLGDALYESLSGGEAKKVDIALILAQRELGININGLECNCIFMDEIMENCDETAIESVTEFLLDKCSAESMFIISHNNYAIPYDIQLTIVKGKDRCSTIQ